MRDTLLSWLPDDLHGRRILDAGCGTGALALEAARRGADVVAIDISPTLVGLAAERSKGHPRLDFRVGDMLDPALGRISHAVSVLGMPGLTAWVGAIQIGQPKPGDTVYVSSAAGAVGQLAGQFAKRAGARVVGSVGSDAKRDHLMARGGFDAVFNYKTTPLDDALRTHCPQGIDVYFDNVGGTTLEAALRHANVAARFPVCGMISAYNTDGDAGIRGLQAVLTKRITMTGFIIYDHVHQLPAYLARVAPWLRSGDIWFDEDIVQGIGQAPAALVGLFQGEAVGKRLVQVAPESLG
jgi:NADPH-dependent curcumin reductase CurA